MERRTDTEPTTTRCTCKSHLVDHRRQTVTHPYRDCPLFGTTTSAKAGTDIKPS